MSEMIYGIHAVQALLERAPERFQEVFILKGREDKRLMPLIHALEAQGVVIQVASRQFLDEKSEGAVHQGIIARVKPGRQYQENDLPDLIASLDQPFFLILDGVTDPHNLGACLRSADAAGVHAVIVPKDRSAQLNATAKKVACGAAENVPLIRVTNLARTMRMLQEENVWIVGTAGEADHTLFQSKMTGSLALVMGAEGEGMRRLTREHCDELISIPMAGSVSALNVSGNSSAGSSPVCSMNLSCAPRFFNTLMRLRKLPIGFCSFRMSSQILFSSNEVTEPEAFRFCLIALIAR